MLIRGWFVWKGARVFCFYSIWIDLYILYLLVIILSDARSSSIGKGVGALTIGTWVRIPGPPKTLMLFFLTYSHAGFRDDAHHAPQISKRQMSTCTNPVVRGEWSQYSNQYIPWTIKKGQTNWQLHGPQNSKLTSVLGQHPLWFILLLILFSSLFNYFTNYYYYYLINSQINYFHNKLKN